MNDHTSHTRPLGYWLRAIDTLLDREFAAAFESEDASRRDWMLLSVIAGDKPGRADRLARKSKRLRMLEDRGWVARTDDGWELTDEGREAKERLGSIVDGIRARVSGAVSPDDYATTMASLETIAREFGWDEEMRMPHRRGRRFGHRPGFGPGAHHGFGPAQGFGPGDEGHRGGPRRFGREFSREEHCHGEHRRGHHGHRRAERAYERGFDAGFARGREA